MARALNKQGLQRAACLQARRLTRPKPFLHITLLLSNGGLWADRARRYRHLSHMPLATVTLASPSTVCAVIWLSASVAPASLLAQAQARLAEAAQPQQDPSQPAPSPFPIPLPVRTATEAKT